MNDPVAAPVGSQFLHYVAIAVGGLAVGGAVIWLSLIGAVAFGRWMDA